MANITTSRLTIDDGTVTWGDLTVGDLTVTNLVHLTDASRVDLKFTKTGSAEHYIRKDGDYLRFRGHDDSTVIFELQNNSQSNKALFPSGRVYHNIIGPYSGDYMYFGTDGGATKANMFLSDGSTGVIFNNASSGGVLEFGTYAPNGTRYGNMFLLSDNSAGPRVGIGISTPLYDPLTVLKDATMGFKVTSDTSYTEYAGIGATADAAHIYAGSGASSTVAMKFYTTTSGTEALSATLSGGDDPILEFNTDGILRSSSGNLTLQAAGDMYLRSQGAQNWYFGTGAATKTMYIEDMADNPVIFFRASRFGYSSTYKTMIFGAPTGAQTICLGVDVSANTNGGFTGAGGEIIFRNDMRFMTPNDANDGFHNYMRMNDGLTTFYTNIYPSSNYTYNLGGGGSIYNGLWVGDVNAAGRVYVTNQGYGTHNVGQGAMKLQIGYSDSTAGLSLARFSADNNGPSIRIAKSKHGTINSHTAVTGATSGTSSTLGTIGWYGSDGNDFDNGAAAITVKASTNASSNSVSGRMIFSTSASGNTWADRMTIAHDGMVGIGTEVPGMMLHVKGGNGNQLRVDNSSEAWTQMNFANNGTDKTFLALDHGNHYFVWGAQNSYSSFDSFRIRYGSSELVIIEPDAGGHANADGATVNIHGNFAMVLGSDHTAATRTDNTTKAARIGLAHYDNDAAPTAMIWGQVESNISYLHLGGGTTWMNAVEQIDFYTAGDTTSGAGTLRGMFKDTGSLQIFYNFILPANKAIYLDGGSDTYIKEYSDNVIHFYTGGTNALQLANNEITVYGNVIPTDDAARNLGSSSKRYLDVFSARLKNADGNASAPSYTFANDLNTGLYRQGNDVLGFSAGGLDTMYINAGVIKVGDVVYNTTVINNSSIFGANAPANYYAITARNPTYNWATIGVQQTGSQTGTANYMIAFYDNAGYIGSIYHAHNDVTYYSTVSDYRLKENETLITGALDRVKRLKPYRFNFKRYPDEIAEGFFAHELDVEVPFAVAGVKDAMQGDDDMEPGEIKPQEVDLAKVVPVLVAAIQELEKRVAELESS